MRSGVEWLVRGLMAAVLFALSSVTANAGAIPCETPLLAVGTEDRELHARICEAAASALRMLETCHLELKAPVTITFSDRLGSRDVLCFGLYHHGKDWIQLLKPEKFEQVRENTEGWTAIPIAEHFDSIVVHEFVHALTDQAPRADRSCQADEEYIAYAMQVASLSEMARLMFLEDLGVSAPIAMEELNPIILGFSPSDFAARSWVHFTQPEHGCAFVGKLIQGEATFYMYPE